MKLKNKGFIFGIICSLIISLSPALATTPQQTSSTNTLSSVGDSVNIIPDSTGMINFSVTGSNAKGAVLVVSQCFNNGNVQNNSTNSCVSAQVTRYNSNGSQSSISTDDSYYSNGNSNCYYLIQMYSENTKVGSVVINLVSTTPPTVSVGNSGTGFAQIPFTVPSLAVGSSGGTSIPGLYFLNFVANNPLYENSAALLNGSVFGSNTLKSINITCIPYVESEVNTPYAIFPSLTNGIGGGDVTIVDHNSSGTTVIGVVTVPNAPEGGPYINYGNLVLSNPFTVAPNDQIAGLVTRADVNPSGINYVGCTLSAGI